MTARLVFVMKANATGDAGVPALELHAAQCVAAAMTGKPHVEIAAAMEHDAAEIVSALHGTLPQGTWARVVALIARRWAADQDGWLPAHRLGTYGKPPDVPLAITWLRQARDVMLPYEPGRAEIAAALTALGEPEPEA